MKELYSGPEDILNSLILRYPVLEAAREDILVAFSLMVRCFEGGGKLLICGNGGSASDGLHIAGELMKSFTLPRPVDEETARRLRQLFPEDAPLLSGGLARALPAVALVESAALNTAMQNDVDSALVFAQQVYGLGRPEDMLLCISTSGNSKNCLYAAETAKAMGLAVISLTGESGGRLKGVSDVTIAAPARECYLVQELHLPVYHALCLMLEYHFFS